MPCSGLSQEGRGDQPQVQIRISIAPLRHSWFNASMSHSILDIPIATLEKVIAIRKQIEALKATEQQILSGSAPVVTLVAKRRGRPPKSVASPAPAAPVIKKKRTMSPEGRARIAAAQKARWAKVKKA